jgi:hypothetical protein
LFFQATNKIEENQKGEDIGGMAMESGQDHIS